MVIMNEVDPLILYTDVSTKAIGGGGGGGGSCKSKNGIEKPVIFISHALSDQATRWGIMELELYAFVYCLKNLTPYLLGKQFTVGTDHRNLLYIYLIRQCQSLCVGGSSYRSSSFWCTCLEVRMSLLMALQECQEQF